MLFLVACTEPAEEDSAAPEEEERPDTDVEECASTEIRYNGSDAPAVGDTWEVLLVCDDAVHAGASKASSDPLDFVSYDDSGSALVATFLLEGTGTLFLQSGRIKAEREVTVGP